MAEFSDDQRANQLAYVRAREKERADIKRTVSSVKPPSKLSFKGYLVMAIILDALDWAELTGVGLILTYALKVIFAPILFMHGINAGSRVKNTNRIAKSLEEAVSHLKKRTLIYRNRLAFVAKHGRKIKALRKPIAVIAKNANKLKKLVVRSPAMKNAFCITADFIPLIDLFPWRTLGVVITYYDEKHTYEETMPAITEFADAHKELIESELAKIAEVDNEFEDEQAAW